MTEQINLLKQNHWKLEQRHVQHVHRTRRYVRCHVQNVDMYCVRGGYAIMEMHPEIS